MKRTILVAALAVVLFAGLVALRYLFTAHDRGQVSPAAAYEQLATALEQEGLGLLSAHASVQRALKRNAADSSVAVISAPDPHGAPSLVLGSVIGCYFGADALVRLELDPRQWRQVKAGALRSALETISRLPLKRQAGSELSGGGLPVQRSTFSFSVVVGVQPWVLTPYFDGQQCSGITIVLADESAAGTIAPPQGLGSMKEVTELIP